MRGPYTFIIDGTEHVPSDFGPLRTIVRAKVIHNPDMLHQDAVRAAERIAYDLCAPGAPVEVTIHGTVAGERRIAAFVHATETDPGLVELTSPSYRVGARIRRAA